MCLIYATADSRKEGSLHRSSTSATGINLGVGTRDPVDPFQNSLRILFREEDSIAKPIIILRKCIERLTILIRLVTQNYSMLVLR